MLRLAQRFRSSINGELDYRTKTYYAISGLMILYSLLYVFAYLIVIKSAWGLLINSSALLFYSVSTFAIFRRHHETAKITQLCTLVLHLLAATFVFSSRAGYHFYFIHVPVISFLFFQQKKRWERLCTFVFSVIAVISFIFCEIYATEVYQEGITGPMFRVISYVGIALIMAGLFVALRIFSVALQKAEEQLILLSTTDVLTGAHNRRYFIEHAEIEIARSQRNRKPLAILMMDIDHFKNINDTLGHQEGDKVLKAVVSMCQECVRGTDILARVGGEEIAALLVDVEKPNAIIVAQRIRRMIDEMRIPSDKADIELSISVGIAFYEKGDKPLADMLKEADAELYRAKEQGRNRVAYSSET